MAHGYGRNRSWVFEWLDDVHGYGYGIQTDDDTGRFYTHQELFSSSQVLWLHNDIGWIDLTRSSHRHRNGRAQLPRRFGMQQFPAWTARIKRERPSSADTDRCGIMNLSWPSYSPPASGDC